MLPKVGGEGRQKYRRLVSAEATVVTGGFASMTTGANSNFGGEYWQKIQVAL